LRKHIRQRVFRRDPGRNGEGQAHW
jgi:hypothetical protein